MSMKLLFAFAATLAGAAIAVQAAVNAGLAARIGLGAALIVSTTIVLAFTVAFHFASGGTTLSLPAGAPWYVYLGGACGFAFILATAFVFPRLGGASSVALVVLGQGATALLLDHYGLLGLEREPVSLSRIGGFALIVAGVVLLRH